MKKSDIIFIIICSIAMIFATAFYVYYNICFDDCGGLLNIIKSGGEDFIVFGAFWVIITFIWIFWVSLFVLGIIATIRGNKKEEKNK